ncbi:MAG: hypothetical protein ACK4J0_02845 [Candidatus Anstonellaceae archaeon]
MNFRVKQNDIKMKPSDARWFFLPKLDGENLIRPDFENKNISKKWEDALNLAKKYFLLGKKEEALGVVLKYLRSEPKNTESYFYSAFFSYEILKDLIALGETGVDYYGELFKESLENCFYDEQGLYKALLLRYEYENLIGNKKNAEDILYFLNSNFLFDPFSNLILAKEKIDEQKKEDAIKYLYNVERSYKNLFDEVFILMEETITSTNGYYPGNGVIKSLEEFILAKEKEKWGIFGLEDIRLGGLQSDQFSEIAIQMLAMRKYADAEKYAIKAIELNQKEMVEKKEINTDAYLVKMLLNMAIVSKVFRWPDNEFYFRENARLMETMDENFVIVKQIDARAYYIGAVNYLNWAVYGKGNTKEIQDYLENAKICLKIAYGIYPFFEELVVLLNSTIEALEIKKKILEGKKS